MIRSAAFFFLVMMLTTPAVAEVIHKERSLYRNIIVEDSTDRRCLVFTVNRLDRNQSCMDLSNPKRLVFPYVRMLFGALLLNPSPQRILMVGLGGGTVPTVLSELLPESRIDVVEIDEAVLRVAREYFDFKTSERLDVVVMDARVYAKRANRRNEEYDLILLDAFTGDYIPEHLMSREFLNEIKALLTTNGVIAANTFSTSDLYDHESVTYTDVFTRFFNFKLPVTANRVVIGSRDIAATGILPDQTLLLERAKALKDTLAPYGIEIEDYPLFMERTIDWDTGARLLTDQYSPANLLNR